MKNFVNMFLTLAVLSPIGAYAQEQWKPGAASLVFNVENGRDPQTTAALDAINGFQRAPFLRLPLNVALDNTVLETLTHIVPRDEELVRLLKFSEDEFASEADSLAERLKDYVTANGETTTQKAAWAVINENAKQKIQLQLELTTRYLPMDFVVNTSSGEGSERRANCNAGFRLHLDLKLVGISFPNNANLTRLAQGALGTRFTHTFDELIGRVVLQQKIDLTKEQAIAFEKECKAQKDKFLP